VGFWNAPMITNNRHQKPVIHPMTDIETHGPAVDCSLV
jgi:hypothetical protein